MMDELHKLFGVSYINDVSNEDSLNNLLLKKRGFESQFFKKEKKEKLEITYKLLIIQAF